LIEATFSVLDWSAKIQVTSVARHSARLWNWSWQHGASCQATRIISGSVHSSLSDKASPIRADMSGFQPAANQGAAATEEYEQLATQEQCEPDIDELKEQWTEQQNELRVSALPLLQAID
jgi:hypothetical protein